MAARALTIGAASLAIAACTTTNEETTAEAVSPAAQIAGMWGVTPENSISTCTLIVEDSTHDESAGRVRDRGCIGLDGLGFVQTWRVSEGRIDFYALTNEHVLTVSEWDRGAFRGRLVRTDRPVVLTRY